MLPYVHCSIITIAKMWKQPKCTNTHTHNGLLVIHKKEWNLTICSNINGSREYYAKWNKSDKERQILYDFIYMWNLKNKNKTEQTHRYR